jgi:hypothetical protein
VKTGGETTFARRVPAVLWAFAGAWLLALAAATAVALFGPADGASRAGVFAGLGVLWLAGLGLWRFASRQRMLRVDVAADGSVTVVWRSPFHAERRQVAAWDVFPAGVVEAATAEGEAMFTCRVVLMDGTWLDLAQSTDRDAVQAVVSRFNAVAGRRPFQ